MKYFHETWTKRIAFLVCCVSFRVVFQAQAAGTEAYSFLKIPVSARVIGTGEASVALVRGAESLYHNPAGLTNSQGWQVASHNLFSSDLMRMNNVSVSGKMGRNALGVGVLALTQPSLEGTDNAGNTTGSFEASDMEARISFARGIAGLNLGGTIKMIRSEIGSVRSNGYAVDIGMQKEFANKMVVGAALVNVGPSVSYQREKAELPSEAKVGVSYPVSNVLLSGEMTRSLKKEGTKFNVGGEYQISVGANSKLSLRSGFVPNTVNASGNDLLMKGLRSGFGLEMKSWSLDYAISPFANLGLSHRVSVGFNFGQGVK